MQSSNKAWVVASACTATTQSIRIPRRTIGLRPNTQASSAQEFWLRTKPMPIVIALIGSHMKS